MALQIGADLIDDFNNGVWIAELAPLSDQTLVPAIISRSLGITEQPGQETETTLLNYLKDKELLLILDNCEHLIDACARITEKILQNCTKVKIIATSREALRSDGETPYRISSLSLPDPNQINTPLELSQYEAVRLFIERALAVNINFRVNNENASSLAQICRHLDGIPLAIELAAARINVMGVEKICEKLSDRFRLLTGGKRTALPRQQTLKAMIDWSYDLLTEKEKILFQRLSVFSGGWTLEAAEEICSNDDIDSFEMLDTHTNLMDKSLINISEKSGTVRFYLLETVKQYANEKLGEDNNLKRRHYNYYSSIGSPEQMKAKGMDQLEWVNSIDSEPDNFRTAIQWASENNEKDVFQIVNSLSGFWEIKGYMLEGIQTVMKVLNSNKLTDEFYKARMLFIAGIMFQGIGNSADAEKYVDESLILFRKLNNKIEIAKCLNLAGQITYEFKTKYNEALELHNQALSIFRESNHRSGIASTLYLMSFSIQLKGDSKTALKYKKEALEIFKELGDYHMTSLVLASLGVIELKAGKNYESARTYSEESLSMANKYGNKYLISINLINLGNVYVGLKQFEKAKEMLEQSVIITKECGYISSLLVAQMYLGDAEAGFGKNENAINFYKESVLTGSKAGINFFLSTNIYGIGLSYFELKDYENSLRYFIFLNSITGKEFDPLGKPNIKKGENHRNDLKELLGSEKYEEIENEVLKLGKEDFIKFAVNDL